MYINQFDRYNGNNLYGNYMQPEITIQDSIQIALSQVSGQIIKIELEIENGILVYEVKVLTPQGLIYEVEVDAITGNVVKVELD